MFPDKSKSYMTTWTRPTVVRFKDRDTGGSKGAMAPSKIFSSCCSKSLLFYYFSVSEYQIGTPRSYAYLVKFLSFISLGSPLEVFTS